MRWPHDQPDIAALVLEHSPLLLDADLVDAVAGRRTASADRHRARAPACRARCPPPSPRSARAEACLVLIENDGAEIAPFSLDRIVRALRSSGGDPRGDALSRDDLPARDASGAGGQAVRDACRISSRRAQWLERGSRPTHHPGGLREGDRHARRRIAGSEVRPLVRHLRESGQLNAGLILRSLLSGNVELFEEALAELHRLPLSACRGIVHDRRGAGFRALYDKAGLPASTFPAFREALEAMREEGFMFELGSQPAQAPHDRARADSLRAARRRARSSRCSRCCAATPPKPRARRPGCSATSWWRTA